MYAIKATTPVHEVMSRAPVTVRPETTVGELFELFDRHDYNAFGVVDGEGTLVGIVTKLDLLRTLRPEPDLQLPDAATVSGTLTSEIMRTGVLTLDGTDPIGVAADLMVESGLRSIPVVQWRGGKPALLGMVSRGDLLRGIRHALHQG